ncbi:MAG: hypothetical protein MRY79_01555 [Alphaproteobacteria bacterium]|nr:hypothetical protein [Alphaproteobacteria bacterium]
MKKDYIPLQDAKNIITTALSEFDPELGVHAAEILSDEERCQILEKSEPTPDKRIMQQYRPSGVTMEDVKASPLYIPNFAEEFPDFAEKFGPHFTRQDNPTDRAIIDFEYHDDPKSVIYLGHELGHAIADDVQRENGHSFKDFSMNEHEEQAYFVQNIVSNYIEENLKEYDISEESDPSKMSEDRAAQFANARETFQKAALANTPDRKKTIQNALDQRSFSPSPSNLS